MPNPPPIITTTTDFRSPSGKSDFAVQVFSAKILPFSPGPDQFCNSAVSSLNERRPGVIFVICVPSRELGVVMAGIARSCRLNGFPVKPPAVLLSGGETTVTIGKGQAGRGGRNTEFLLAFAIAMAGEPGLFALAADSDGIDGTEDAAGAFVTADTLGRACIAKLDPRGHLAAHDSYSFFAGVGDLIRTGPTGTNVNDIRAVLITRGGQPAD